MATIARTEKAQRWLEDIFEYVAADNPRAAAGTVNGIYERAQVLAEFPQMGYRYRGRPVTRPSVRTKICCTWIA